MAEPRRERKVVTVLFADLVGFTSRAEQLDPEDIEEILRPYHERLRAELERHGGTVEKFIGDAVMALFGAPVAHEDDPERAVRAALAIREAMTEAARLQSAAPIDGILVDETTYRATRDVIHYEEADPVSAKGKAEPVPVWEAKEARARFGTDVVQTGAPLVGRRRELDLLAYGEGVTYWALAEMVKAQAGILETDGPDAAEAKLAEMVGDLVAEGEEQLLESLRPLVGLAETGDGEQGADRSARFAAWRRLFESLSEHRPTVLVFEDLHWAGDDLLDFVDHLVDWAAGVPLLVVCTARPELLERRPGWGGGKSNALTLSISPLSDDDTARLLAELLERSVLPAETQASLLARAGGNPLYAEQFARLLAEAGNEDLRVPRTSRASS